MEEMFWRVVHYVFGFLGVSVTAALYALSSFMDKDTVWLLAGGTAALAGIVTGKLLKYFRRGACTDSLTGLWNRGYFNRRLMEEMERAQRSQSSLCIAMIDTDNFKRINDSYGHVAGDKLLIELARMLKANTRTFDVVSRWGGDEFAVIFPDTTVEGALAVAERLRLVVQTNPDTYGVTLSIGILPVGKDTTVIQAIEMADQALYKAKRRKNEVAVWHPGLFRSVCRASLA
ncbi:GGDEF domain-containing protein [Sporolituus thermophilus]|nr:GGDEF domain-containing protein [Sporolituus thermophilus]